MRVVGLLGERRLLRPFLPGVLGQGPDLGLLGLGPGGGDDALGGELLGDADVIDRDALDLVPRPLARGGREQRREGSLQPGGS